MKTTAPFNEELLDAITALNKMRHLTAFQEDVLSDPNWDEDQSAELAEGLSNQRQMEADAEAAVAAIVQIIRARHGSRKASAELCRHTSRVSEIAEARQKIVEATKLLPHPSLTERVQIINGHLRAIEAEAKLENEGAVRALRVVALNAERPLHDMLFKPNTKGTICAVAANEDTWPFRISMMRDSIKDSRSTSNPKILADVIGLGKSLGIRIDSSKPRGKVVSFAISIRKSIMHDIDCFGLKSDQEILGSRHANWPYRLGQKPSSTRKEMQKKLLSYIRAAQALERKPFSNPSLYAESWAEVGIMMAEVHTDGDIGKPGVWPDAVYRRKADGNHSVESKLKERMKIGFYQLHSG